VRRSGVAIHNEFLMRQQVEELESSWRVMDSRILKLERQTKAISDAVDKLKRLEPKQP